MLKARHIILAGIAAMISAQALAGWTEFKEVPVPPTMLRFTSGEQRPLSAFKGKVVVLNVWATWCGPCLLELPTLEALEKELAPQGLVVIPMAVDRELTPAILKEFLKHGEIDMPHAALDDAARGVQHALSWGIGVPVTYLIDRKGIVRYQYIGSTNWMAPPRKDKVKELLAEGK